MQCLNTVHSTGKYCNRGYQHCIVVTHVDSDIKAAGRYKNGTSRTKWNSKES